MVLTRRLFPFNSLTTASDSEEFDPEENSRRVHREVAILNHKSRPVVLLYTLQQILRQREERRQRVKTHASPSPSVKREHHRASVPYDIHRDTSEIRERELHLSPTPVNNEVPRHADPVDHDEDYVDDDVALFRLPLRKYADFATRLRWM